MIIGTSKPIFVYHRKYGMMKTNLQFRDEGELRDKDGSFICDEEVWPHQDWKNSKDGYLRDSKENRIFYKDGTPVPIIKMPELVRKMYEEEIGCSKESNDDDYKE
jgi:hypothetical protein